MKRSVADWLASELRCACLDLRPEVAGDPSRTIDHMKRVAKRTVSNLKTRKHEVGKTLC